MKVWAESDHCDRVKVWAESDHCDRVKGWVGSDHCDRVKVWVESADRVVTPAVVWKAGGKAGVPY